MGKICHNLCRFGYRLLIELNLLKNNYNTKDWSEYKYTSSAQLF